jgi:hypothetical protein
MTTILYFFFFQPCPSIACTVALDTAEVYNAECRSVEVYNCAVADSEVYDAS